MASQNQQPSLFSLEISGERLAIDPENQDYQLHYRHPNGNLYLGDSLKWLQSLEDSFVDLIFADPPYNIKKAEWDNFESQEVYIQWSLQWIKEASRILKPSGSMFVCGFSEIISDIKHPALRYFNSCRWLVWHYKNKANLGNDWGRSHESILHFRKSKSFTLNVDSIRIPYGNHTLKYPDHPQASTSNFSNGKNNHQWKPNPLGAKPKDVIEIPTTCNNMEEKTPHPTQKPEELLRKLILAASTKGDLILDPFSGSGTTLAVSQQLARKWLGCESNLEYNLWAMDRIDRVYPRSEQDWIDLDRKNLERRTKIR